MVEVQIKVEADKALARFSPAGIPEQVRKNLRTVIPDITRQLMKRVDDNLGKLKSRSRLQTQGKMIESATQLTGTVAVEWTGDDSGKIVPQVLESGAKPHVIDARNARALSFIWPVLGGRVFFRRVNHPGFPGIHYMQDAFDSMRAEIVSELTDAIQKGANE